MLPSVMNYRVAGFRLTVYLPAGCDADTLLPSFRPFRCQAEEEAGEELFRFEALASPVPFPEGRLADETLNDMGCVRLYDCVDTYRVDILSVGGSVVHRLLAARDFSRATACLDWREPDAGQVLSSMLRIVFSQAILLHGGVSIHASAVCHDGRAYLFMGKSGTGKSTHSALWLKHIPGCTLLNDDNPAVRLVGDGAVAYGTPWSGKTPCYRNLSYPIGGMVRLSQAPANRFVRRREVDAFVVLYPGCSVITDDERLNGALCDTLARLTERVTVGTLECLPDEAAARLCWQNLYAINPGHVQTKV